MLSAVVGALILALGLSYQYYYTEEWREYREELVESYHQFNKNEPSEVELRHWATLALGRYGLERVEKDFIRTAKPQ